MTLAQPPAPSLIDIFGTGYRVLSRCPWLLTLPIITSLYLWLSAPLRIGALPADVAAWRQQHLRATNITVPDELITGLQFSDMRISLAWLNLLPILPPPVRPGGPVLIVASLGGLGLAALAINLATLLLSSLFLVGLAGAVQDNRQPLNTLLRRSLGLAGSICICLLIVLGIGLVAGLPFLAFSALAITAVPAAAGLIFLFWYVIGFWVYAYTGFAVEALLLSNVGPPRALLSSIRMVRRNFWPVAGLLLLSSLISAGMGLLWEQIAHYSTIGLLLALICSAYINSGLAAARLEFYRVCIQ